MRIAQFVLFFGTVLAVYGALNAYIFIRGWQAIPAESPGRIVYLILFLLLALSFIGGRIAERFWLSPLSEALVWTGSFWLAAMLYLFLAALCLDVLRLINLVFPFFPSWDVAQYASVKLSIATGVACVVALVLFGGTINARHPMVRELSVDVRKPLRDGEQMTIVAVSDIHLGTIIGRDRFERIVDRINSLHPDLVLLPGDVMDEDLAPVIKENLGEMLRAIKAPLGVVAITGNHEYIGGADEACRYMREHGVTVLRDEVIRLSNGVTIVGREDRSISQFAGKRRMPLGDLLSQVDSSYPVILMDHQPFHLEEAVAGGVDLQLSGHTHHGQLWPLNYITEAVYEVSRGYVKKGDTHIYVSSGAGTWGPPVRTGNRPEIVHLTLRCEARGKETHTGETR